VVVKAEFQSPQMERVSTTETRRTQRMHGEILSEEGEVGGEVGEDGGVVVFLSL